MTAAGDLAPYEARSLEIERQIAQYELELRDILDEKLTHAQVKWLEAYLRDGHGANAAEGCSKKYLARLACENLKDNYVTRAIQLSRRIAVWRERIDVQRHVRWVSDLVLSDFTSLEYDDQGRPVVNDANRHLWPYVQPRKVRKIHHKDHTETVIEYTIPSKLEAARVILTIAGLEAGSLAPQGRTEAKPVVAGVSVNDLLGLPAPKAPAPDAVVDAEIVEPGR